MEDFPNKSIKVPNKVEEKEEKKEVKSVVQGGVKVKKRSKFAEIFLPEDIDSVKNYIFTDVFIPMVKNSIADAVSMFLFGDVRSSRGRSDERRGSSYTSYFDRPKKRDDRREPDVDQSSREIIFDLRQDAEDVLAGMEDQLNHYGVVSVADLYDLAGMTCNYTDNKFGWTSLRNAYVTPYRGGYIIKLPRAMVLD